MRAWFVPSWHGDVRLIPNVDDAKKTTMVIFEPTEAEKIAIGAIGGIMVDRGWIDKPITEVLPAEPYRDQQTTEIIINAPLEEVGPVVVAALKPGPAVLTAVMLKDGKVEVCEHREPGKATEKELKALAKKPAEAAATVKRPTPSCPDCYVDAIKPATETLLAFLTPDQHETWASGRYIVCRGGLTQHRYILAHRYSELAASNTRICFDVDDRKTLHFHDQSVPPEEEVLAAMLCLQHREPWLRNEATCLGLGFSHIFKNPFGGALDGVADANLTATVGMFARGLAMTARPKDPGVDT